MKVPIYVVRDDSTLTTTLVITAANIPTFIGPGNPRMLQSVSEAASSCVCLLCLCYGRQLDLCGRLVRPLPSPPLPRRLVVGAPPRTTPGL